MFKKKGFVSYVAHSLCRTLCSEQMVVPLDVILLLIARKLTLEYDQMRNQMDVGSGHP